MSARFIDCIETQTGYAMLYVCQSQDDDLHFAIIETGATASISQANRHTKCYSFRALKMALQNLNPRSAAPA
jgi:hypothetical protein